MLVEDDRESRRMIAAVLRAAGASVVPVESATAALDAFEQQPPEIVITDIAMPEMDGYAFTRALRARPAAEDVKIIALTAFSAGKNDQSNFAAYLLKPIDPFHLVDEVARVANRAKK